MFFLIYLLAFFPSHITSMFTGTLLFMKGKTLFSFRYPLLWLCNFCPTSTQRRRYDLTQFKHERVTEKDEITWQTFDHRVVSVRQHPPERRQNP